MLNRKDRRIVRTREAIREAFVDLIEEKGFDGISISDITDRADINRSTFYLHYHDKYDLLEKTEDEIIGHMKTILIQSGKLDLDTYSTEEGLVPVIIAMFEYVKSQTKIMHALLGLKANPGFQSRIKKAIETDLFNLGFFYHKNESDLLVPADYLITYLSAAHMGVVQTWLANGCRESPEEMARIVARMSLYGPFQAVKKRISRLG